MDNGFDFFLRWDKCVPFTLLTSSQFYNNYSEYLVNIINKMNEPRKQLFKGVDQGSIW